MPAKIITHGRIELTAEDHEHLQALAAKRGWSEIDDFHVFTPLVQPPNTPEQEAWGMKMLKELGLLDKKRVS